MLNCTVLVNWDLTFCTQLLKWIFTSEIVTSYRRILRCVLYLIISILLFSCNSVINNSESNSGEKNWLIPKDQVFVATGKDGIPSIDNPEFIPVSEVKFIKDEELVLGVRFGSEIRAYPHQILEYHEILNDFTSDGDPFILTYCPLTGSGICFIGDLQGVEQVFGVSGMLYNNNLIMFDRETESYWSQMLLKSVAGSKIGSRLELSQTVEMKWKYWKEIYPDSKVLSRETGFSRNYGLSLYGTYKTNHSLIQYPYQVLEFNRDIEDYYKTKDRVYTIVEGDFGRAFPIEEFNSEISLQAIEFANSEYIVIGSRELGTISAFIPKLPDDTSLTMDPVIGDLPVVARDQFGNGWDLFGYAVSGPNEGERLQEADGYMAYWFAWLGFVRNIIISEKGTTE